MGNRHVDRIPGTHEDRPFGAVHRWCRVWAAGSLPASYAGPRLRRDIQTLCTSDRKL